MGTKNALSIENLRVIEIFPRYFKYPNEYFNLEFI